MELAETTSNAQQDFIATFLFPSVEELQLLIRHVEMVSLAQMDLAV
jgi:hypothetical protein